MANPPRPHCLPSLLKRVQRVDKQVSLRHQSCHPLAILPVDRLHKPLRQTFSKFFHASCINSLPDSICVYAFRDTTVAITSGGAVFVSQ